MVLLNLNRESKIPLFKQVFNQLKEKIENEDLNPGEKLPATRAFSVMLGVNRTTIYKAYQELWALGYIESKSGSYSYVRQKREVKTEKLSSNASPITWELKVNENSEQVYKMYSRLAPPFSSNVEEFAGTDFSLLHPDSRIFPVSEFKKILSHVITDKGEEIFDYGDSRGYAPLRDFIARRLRLHGVNVDVNEILITNGAQNGIDLIMKLFAKPGSRVFVESPTYGMIIPTLHYYNCEIVGIPMRNDGVDLDKFEKEIQKGVPIFFYTMPNFHNPTGITTKQSHREKLIALAEKYSIPILEDAFEEEMKYFGKVPLPIKSMDVSQIVFYVGSFSKILFPGIRLGWIAANKDCIARLTTLKRFSDISTAVPIQSALADFCFQGQYELHIKRIHKIYRKRMLFAMSDIEKNLLIKNLSWIKPNGGFTIWFTLENIKIGYTRLNQIFSKYKVRVALGKDFYPHSHPENKLYFRVAISTLNQDEIAEGVKRLAKAINYINSH